MDEQAEKEYQEYMNHLKDEQAEFDESLKVASEDFMAWYNEDDDYDYYEYFDD